MKFIISEEERNRILNMHENATKNQYLILNEQRTVPKTENELSRGVGYFQVGDSNELVGKIQTILKSLGYRTDEPNNTYDEQTKGEVERFQTDNSNKLKVDGLLGRNTWKLLTQINNKNTTVDDVLSGRKVMKVNDRGEGVKRVQQALVNKGLFSSENINSIFDEETKNVVGFFQNSLGLITDDQYMNLTPPYGEIDSELMKKILSTQPENTEVNSDEKIVKKDENDNETPNSDDETGDETALQKAQQSKLEKTSPDIFSDDTIKDTQSKTNSTELGQQNTVSSQITSTKTPQNKQTGTSSYNDQRPQGW
jgi:peptidoglycan hydrolase-like protein with peptidoglycan-binding domain